MNYKAFVYTQDNQKYINLVLPFKVINEISKVLIYGKEPYGYQREISELHSDKIKKGLLNEDVQNRNFLLPTSIILSVDKDYIESKINTIEEVSGLVEVDINIDPQEKHFRVVDGQHRLKGLEKAALVREELNNFMLNVVVLITEPNNRVIEVEVFRDINSMAKKVKTDLTTLAIYNYELLGKKDIEDINKHVSIKTAYILSEKFKSSVWSNAIIFDINQKNNIGIIGLSPFITSIIPIVKSYISNKEISFSVGEEIIEQIDNEAYAIAEFISIGWEKVRKKWGLCFEEKVTKDIDESYLKTFFNNNYYLQKTTGTSAINDLLQLKFEEYGFNDDAFNSFETILENSQVKSEDWIVGGPFSGLTSKSGFKKAKRYILNELPIRG